MAKELDEPKEVELVAPATGTFIVEADGYISLSHNGVLYPRKEVDAETGGPLDPFTSLDQYQSSKYWQTSLPPDGRIGHEFWLCTESSNITRIPVADKEEANLIRNVCGPVWGHAHN